MKQQHPLILLILDGWGYREARAHNAIAQAKTPTWDNWWATCPHVLLSGSGGDVGLPSGQMGNSEVGHITLGAGRVVLQSLTRIDKAIESGDFFRNPALTRLLEALQQQNKALHILGLLSPGGVHSHQRHIHALLELAARYRLPDVCIHAILDGRDVAPKSALESLDALEAQCAKSQCGRIVSLVGRYYAMDRDNRWQRSAQAYALMAHGDAPFTALSASAALKAAYARGESDEFVQPTVIHAADASATAMQAGDGAVFMNFRADRARQLTRAFVDDTLNVDGFVRANKVPLTDFVCLCSYAEDIKAPVAFAPEPLVDIAASAIAKQGLRQLRIAETEKYAHVTFFFNGGEEQAFTGEERVLIPSPSVATYDEQPAMSAPQITERLCTAIREKMHEVIICNLANADMVGHTGDFAATVQAIEAIDHCLQQLQQAIDSAGGELLITADHGNAEAMFDEARQQAHTAHTCAPVPFLYVGRSNVKAVAPLGTLSDVAPTLLHLLGLSVPKAMTGRSLFQHSEL